MKLILTAPRGFCAGVERAIEIVERTIKQFGSPIYVKHEIVHNKFVVDGLRKKGAIFVEEIKDIPQKSVVIFSAHGVSQAVTEDSKKRCLTVIDATCPLVKKVHYAVQKHDQENIEIVLIGHAGHPEVEGTMGQLRDRSVYLVSTLDDICGLSFGKNQPLAYTTQTTLSVDETKDIIKALKEKFPHIKGPEEGDLCYATTNRQKAIHEIIPKLDLLLVVGSKNSSNSNRLKEIALSKGVKSYLIDFVEGIDQEWFEGVETVGLTSGASAPEKLVQDVVKWMQGFDATLKVEESVLLKEGVTFPLPKILR